MSPFAQETWAQLRRWLLRLKREPFNLTFALLQPLMFFVFFGGAFLFGLAIGRFFKSPPSLGNGQARAQGTSPTLGDWRVENAGSNHPARKGAP